MAREVHIYCPHTITYEECVSVYRLHAGFTAPPWATDDWRWVINVCGEECMNTGAMEADARQNLVKAFGIYQFKYFYSLKVTKLRTLSTHMTCFFLLFSMLKVIKVSLNNIEEEYFFICRIHNYTEYNQQWNVCSAFNPSKCTHTWSSGQPTLWRPGSSWGFGALLKGLTSVVDNSCQSRDSNPQPRVTCLTVYPLEPRLPHFYFIFLWWRFF